jgi:alpha-2-macroglobulin
MKCHLTLIVIALLVRLEGFAAPPPADVELINDSGEFLQASSTLEFRFARPIVDREQISGAAAQSPIVLQPDLPGRFTWLSRRSGVYVPENVPPLGVSYQVLVRRGLKAADGKPIGEKFRATLRTPAFGILAVHNGVDDKQDIDPRIKVRVVFNSEIEEKAALGVFKFVNDKGEKISSVARYATSEDESEDSTDDERDWEARWREARSPSSSDTAENKGEKTKRPLLNRLIISPERSLSAGRKWRLEMAPGLRSRSGKYQIAKRDVVDLGLVKPFTLKELKTSSYINSGRSVTLEFTQEVAPDVTNETGVKFFHITPPVANLRIEEGYQGLTLYGDFKRAQPYRLEFDKAVIAQNGLPFDGDRVRTFSFAPVRPRLYLPEITGHQISAGTRKFDVHSGNLKALHVTARLVPPSEIPRAIAAFSQYTQSSNEEGESDEFYQKLPDDAIPGAVISEEKIDISSVELDTPQKTSLDWDKIAGAKKAGAIFLTVEGEPRPEAGGGKAPGAQALIQLTDLGILWKRVGNELRVTVFSHTTGKPVPGAQVALLNPDFGQLATAQTDSVGLAKLPVTSEPGWLLAQQGDDAHAMRVGKNGTELSMGSKDVSVYYRDWGQHAEKSTRLRAFYFTDRPLYQPEEEVKVKGILREMRDGKLSPAKNRGGKMTLRDDRGETVADVDLSTNDAGAFDTSLKLKPGVGKHTVSFRPANVGDNETYEGESVTFDVASYQPNAFELKVATAKRLRADEAFRAAVSAKYFFGAPITKSQARWTLRYMRDAFKPDGFDEFSFGTVQQEEGNVLTLRGEGGLAGAQELIVDPKLPKPVGVPYAGVLTVEVTDANQQTVSDTQRVVQDASDFYLGMAPLDRSVVLVGDEVTARAVAVQADGTPLPNPVKINAELVRLHHETVRMQSAGKGITFKTETREEKIAETTGDSIVPKKIADSWDANDGAGVRFKIPRAGDYRIRITAKDGGGHDVISELEVFGSGPEALAWNLRQMSQVDLVPDKSEYQPGEKARILVKTQISGKATVSIEREDTVLRSMEVQLDGNAPSFEVPVTAGDTPNVCVSLMLIRGAEASTRKFKMPDYRYGVCNLHVANPASRLQISVSPTKPEVQPGDEVETEISVRDGKGSAVENAEVTFFAIDDGVLALTGYARPAPGEIFHRPVPLFIRNGLSLYELMPEDPSDLTFENKGYLIGGGGAEGPGTKLRHDFPGTACWMPSLHTDRKGKVRARFKAPDALTRYRLVAVVHAGSEMFGSGESAFAIRKPLMVLPALGLFANVGDELKARAVIRNDTGADGVVDLTLQLDQTAESSQPTTAKIDIKNGEGRTVDFPVKFKAVGRAQWKWSARMQSNGRSFGDEVQTSLEVGSPMLVLREIYSTDAREASNDLLAGVNPQILEGTGRAALTVANTRLASLRGSVNHLREYPYGCAEQTVSSLIPWIVLPDLRPVLPELTDGDSKKAIAKGLEKIGSMQTSSGGLAFWPGGHRADLFPSAYAAIALALLEKQGTPVKDRQEKLLKYLSEELRGLNKLRDETALGDRVLAAYALAISGRPEAAYQEELYRRRAELSHESRALLALAVLESKAPAAMIEDLLDPRKPAPETFSWYSAGAREAAVELMAWSEYKPTAPEVSRLANELLHFRKNGRWHTTQENAWALMALARYFKNVEGGGKPAHGSVVFNQKNVPFDVTSEHPSKTENFDFDQKNSLSALRVENPQKSIVFADVDFKANPPLGDQPRQDRGFAVSRSYRKIGDDGALLEPADLKVGDRVLITLRIELSRAARFVAIDDPFPSIFEAINPAFVSRAAGEGEELATDYYSDYREMRADRVLIFCDSLPTGAFTFRYLARVRSAGTAMAGSTKAEEMYRPERFGLSETMRVTSRAVDDK